MSLYKLIILIEPPDDLERLENLWPQFLHLAEQIPGLVREASCNEVFAIFGRSYVRVHELFFESREAAEKGLNSPNGTKAGQMLQLLTGGKMTLLLAMHQEDALENFKSGGRAA